MAEPAREAGKTLQDFWGPESDAFAAYQAAQGRYKKFIDRAFEEEIQSRRSELEDTKSEPGDIKITSSSPPSKPPTNRLLDRWRFYAGIPIRS